MGDEPGCPLRFTLFNPRVDGFEMHLTEAAGMHASCSIAAVCAADLFLIIINMEGVQV